MKKILDWLNKYKYIIIAVIVVLIISFIVGRLSANTIIRQQTENLIAARDSIKQYSVKIAGLENFVFEKNAIILSQKESIEAGIIENERLRKLHLKELVTNTELAGTIKILRDSLKLQPGTTIITIKDTTGLSHDYVKIPFKLLDVKEKYVSLAAGMNVNCTAYFDLSVPFTGTISIGYIKSGFLKTTPKGVYTTTNPYITVNSMDVLIVKEKERFYNKTWFHVLCGAGIVEGINLIIRR
jgi:hypothetical protein